MGILLTSTLVAVFFVNLGLLNGKTKTEIKPLKTVEIREYEGQILSSIDVLRENSIRGPQRIDEENYRLLISGLVTNEVEYTYSDVVTDHIRHQKVVTLYCVEGWDATILWEGVLVKDLIEKAEINPAAKVVIFYASDGYSTSLPLDYIIKEDIIMAHKMNGIVLPPERGFPFQLVAESKFGYQWIK